MVRPTRPPIALALATLPLLWGCTPVLTPTEMEVDVSAETSVAAPGDPVQVQVTVRNLGETRVQWGGGSSSCQLALVVRVDGEDRQTPDKRWCTADVATYTLAPGETRTETLSWEGEARVGQTSRIEQLPPGVYEVRGFALRAGTSEPILVTLGAGP